MRPNERAIRRVAVLVDRRPRSDALRRGTTDAGRAGISPLRVLHLSRKRQSSISATFCGDDDNRSRWTVPAPNRFYEIVNPFKAFLEKKYGAESHSTVGPTCRVTNLDAAGLQAATSGQAETGRGVQAIQETDRRDGLEIHAVGADKRHDSDLCEPASAVGERADRAYQPIVNQSSNRDFGGGERPAVGLGSGGTASPHAANASMQRYSCIRSSSLPVTGIPAFSDRRSAPRGWGGPATPSIGPGLKPR